MSPIAKWRDGEWWLLVLYFPFWCALQWLARRSGSNEIHDTRR